MDPRKALLLALAVFFIVGAQTTRVAFTNKCPFTVWPGTLTGGGVPQLPVTGFELPSKSSSSIHVPANWTSGRFWARTGCSTDSTGKFSCLTGDCASGKIRCVGAGAIPPVTLMEFTLGASSGLDFFDISLVDGFNLPVAVNQWGGGPGVCRTPSCPGDVNGVCPPEMAVKGPDGRVIACKSACLALNKPEYCCTGQYGSPATCPPTQYSKIFKGKCPQAYSYAYDDASSTFTCPTGRNYLITFCP
ncbi:unnamed protein product [Linum tenue]|uniref:Thaumatin-like protein n=1 Tax=Linum tenue TaxID=586396 RepID=A0AAV0PGE3_9ROSI|nr:unnamed protein product [Linum tenue]